MIFPQSTEILHDYSAAAEKELAAILSFWRQNAMDFSQGGFVGQMDNAGKVNRHAPKGSILNARILWTFSAAFRHTKETGYLAVAHRAYVYLSDHFLDSEHGGVYWSVAPGGKPLDTRKQVYAVAFAIYGLSEYYRATGEARALNASRDLFTWIEECSFDKESGGYFEAFGRKGEVLDDLRLSEKDRNDPKTMNTHLHILEAYTSLYRIWQDPFLAQQLEGLLNVFPERLVDASTGHLNLFFDRYWTVTSGVVSFGHDIEASWLLPEAAGVLGNGALLKKINKVARGMAVAAVEGLQPDGSLVHERDPASGHDDRHREWWVTAEAMVGFLNAYQLTGETAFLERSLGCWTFAKRYLLDKKNGGWFWGVLDDYSIMKEDKIGFWKCPYHNARACLEVVRRCEALLNVSEGKN